MQTYIASKLVTNDDTVTFISILTNLIAVAMQSSQFTGRAKKVASPGPRKRGFSCPFGRVLTTEGRVRSGNGTSYFLSKFMNVVLSVKFSQLLKRHLADEYSTERL